MENKFTPGPWFYQEDADVYTHIIRPQSNPGSIIVHMRQDTSDEHKANAKLIAAAPELLEALQVALWNLENGEAEAQKQGKPRLAERAEIYRNAIKKATE